MSLRCDQCGYENSENYRFCGRCGAMLQATVATRQAQPQRVAEPNPHVPPVRQTLHSPAAPAPPPVTGPSFLGLSAEPQKTSVEYLLEDDPGPPNHHRMMIALFLLLLAAGVLAWHWRDAVLGWWAQLHNTNPVVSVAPVSTPSKTGGPALGSSAATGQAPSEPIAPTVSSITPRRTPPPLPSAGEANMIAPDSGTASSANTEKQSADSTSAPVPSRPKPPMAAEAQTPPERASSETSTRKSPSKPVSSRAAAVKPVSPKETHSDAAAAGSADDRLVAEGQKYLYADGVPENCARAEKNFRTAAGHSNAHAMSLLGTMYATGHCVGLDLPTAYRWYARALHLEPSNDRISQDLQVLWRQMNADQRQAAIKAESP